MKKFLSTMLAIALAFAVISSTSPTADAIGLDIYDKIPNTVGTDIVCEKIALWDNGNYICITVDTGETVVPYGPVQPHVLETFTHIIYDRNGNFIANFTTLVTGQVTDVSASIISVSGTFSNAIYSDLSYYTSYNGNTATVYITKAGASIGSLKYKISSDGTISNI